MDDDFNTGGAVGTLFDLRTAINGFIQEHKLESTGKSDPALVAALIAACRTALFSSGLPPSPVVFSHT